MKGDIIGIFFEKLKDESEVSEISVSLITADLEKGQKFHRLKRLLKEQWTVARVDCYVAGEKTILKLKVQPPASHKN